MLAAKQSVSAMPAQLQATRDYTQLPGSRRTPLSDTSNRDQFASPTESEFSEHYESHDSVRSWDEKQVGDWLRSIGCGAYTQTFKDNNVNGNNLIECDQAVLKEMGIKKIGDRVRIFVGIKALRSKAGTNQKKRNRESMANLDKYASLDTPSAISPMGTNHRTKTAGTSKRFSTQIATPIYAGMSATSYPSPSKGSFSSGYFSQPASAKTPSGRRPETPSGIVASTKLLPQHVRVIHNEQTKIFVVKEAKTFEDIMGPAVKKIANRNEQHIRNYCFWVHDPSAEEPNRCRRLTEKEVIKTCHEQNSAFRGRLILKAIHAGEPSTQEIERSKVISAEDIRYEYKASFGGSTRHNLDKVQRIFGESIEVIQEPHSPAVMTHSHTPITDPRRPTLPSTKLPASRPKELPAPTKEFLPPKRTDSKPKKQLNKFMGARPPSEFINYDLTTYFPDHDSKAIERTVSMAQRRSARMSKALSRLSTASNFSVKEALKDAPAVPSLPSFLTQDPFAGSGATESKATRPLSLYRQSVASAILQPLKEEGTSEIEPDRKSYVSFGDSASELSATPAKSDTATDSSATAIFDDGSSIGASSNGANTLHSQCREALATDGEGPDDELDAFLTGNTFDKFSWMQGALIGQGSFGSVYLALHAVTGELMAVKQVGLPGKSGADPALDKRKESMLAALKREINLLSDLQHENIVQYLGVQATDEHLNIFLEYVPGGSVASMLNNYGHLQEPLIRNFVRQILSGLSYLHKRDIIHRDIKGANILVDNKGKVKISDFGISKKVELSSASGKDVAAGAGGNKRVSMQGSVFWMAPEVVRRTSYTRKADIWSMGCLVVEMFTGEHPFPKMNQMQAIFKLGASTKPEMPEICSAEAKEFLEKTFDIDESKRPEAEELQELPFLKTEA